MQRSTMLLLGGLIFQLSVLEVLQGTLQIRKVILDDVGINNGLRRPPANVLRRRGELTQIGLT